MAVQFLYYDEQTRFINTTALVDIAGPASVLRAHSNAS